jgi:type I restriction enzyme S subunit
MDKQNYQIYKFENIAINSNAKRMPTDADMETYIGLEHLDSGSLKVSRWGSATPIKGEKLIMQKGDVLFGKRNAYLRRTAIAPHDGLFSAHGMILRPKTNVIIPELFPHFLSSTPFYDAAIRISVGSTSPTINWRDLKELTFPVPPISEQKKIADALWAIEDALNAYRTLLASTDELVKSQFVEMFYDKGYPVKTIGDVIAKKIDRVAKVFEKEDTIQYLDISSIDNSSKTVTGLTTYSLAEAPSRAQYVLKQGDILYSTVRPNLQNIAINPYSDNNVVGSTGFCVLRCTGVTTGYMWGVINSTPFVDAMINQAYGANYPAVTDKVVHAYEIPIPPVQAQKAYEELVEQSDKSKAVFQKRRRML